MDIISKTLSRSLKVVIVDDEPIACTNLKDILLNYIKQPINICGLAYNTNDAELLIEAFQPELVFLDIEMPREKGLHFLERIFPFNFEVVFVTAYDTFAVKAFRLNALDYIMKPIDIEYLQHAVGKIVEKIVFKDLIYQKEIISKNAPENKIEKMFFRTGNSMEMVEISQIIYISANWSYTNIFYLKNQQVNKITMSYPIAKYDQQLSGYSFYRIHKSYLVNVGFIERIITEPNTIVQLSHDIQLPVSRRKYAGLLSFMSKNKFPMY